MGKLYSIFRAAAKIATAILVVGELFDILGWKKKGKNMRQVEKEDGKR